MAIDNICHRWRARSALLVLVAATAASAKPEANQQPAPPQFGWQASTATKAPLTPPIGRRAHTLTDAASESSGRVITVMEASGFNTVYLELESGAHRFWIAAGITDVRTGNRVQFSRDQATAMDNFESKALKRTFDRIYFVPAITVAEIDP